jgi:exonuclease V gamma subunit
MKKIERLKSSKDSNFQKETVGQKLSQFRNKLNEIIDYINDKEQMEEYKRCVEEVVNELISENLNDDDDIVIESDEQ